MQDHEVSGKSEPRGPHWSKRDLAKAATAALVVSFITDAILAIIGGVIIARLLSPWIDLPWWRAALLVIVLRICAGKE